MACCLLVCDLWLMVVVDCCWLFIVSCVCHVLLVVRCVLSVEFVSASGV